LTYEDFARRLTASGIITDPWLGGAPRFREQPVIVRADDARRMYRAAEAVAEAYNELCLIVADAPELLESFFCLTPYQRAMWMASRPLWHGIARADVFVTNEGLQIAELNCDTPTGEAEAIVMGSVAMREGYTDPNRRLESRIVDVAEAMWSATVLGQGAPPPDTPETRLRTLRASRSASVAGRERRAALLYPTEIPEDLSLVRLYKRAFESRGWDLVLGSPYNLEHEPGGLSVFGERVSLVLRHYKTDWWTERQSAWDDEDVPDALPLEAPLEAMLAAMLEGEVCVVNPFGAVVPQNKRAMAFMWEQIHRFSRKSQDTIRSLVPMTRRLDAFHTEQLLAEKDDWVLKSDYGAEGDEVVVGRWTTPDVWRESLAHARPSRWIAQRFFEAKENDAKESVNHGVFVLAGDAAGLYARVQRGATDESALSVPLLVEG
jgi:glutathionylspermidine synthase